jgi:hypothetical protein
MLFQLEMPREELCDIPAFVPAQSLVFQHSGRVGCSQRRTDQEQQGRGAVRLGLLLQPRVQFGECFIKSVSFEILDRDGKAMHFS